MKKFLKKNYKFLPFKKILFSFLKLFWKPNENIHKHLYFRGKIQINAGKSSFRMMHYGFQLENELFWRGLEGWEKESVSLWLKLCEKSDVIFDLGANTGIYSLLAKTINKNSKVYAFEPVKRVFEKLKYNIELNNYDIVSVEKAISNYDGKAIIYDDLAEHVYSVTVNQNLRSPSTKVKEVEIETETLNTFIKQNNIDKIDLMKIDVETHEPEVLQGFSEYLSIFKPTILIEILNEEVAAKVNKIVFGLNYCFYNIDEEKGVNKVDIICKSYSFNFLLCQPDVAEYLGLDR